MDEKTPYIKEHNGTNICFADTIEQACNALKGTNLKAGEADKLQGGHLMLFGVEDWKNNINDLTGAFKSASNTFTRLEVFGCEMDKQAQLSFANSLGNLNNVKHLDLDNTALEPEGAGAIFAKVANSGSIEKLNLQGSIPSKAVMEKINEALSEDTDIWQKLQNLDLKINDLKPESAAIVADLMMKFAEQEGEVKLDLFYNDIQAPGAIAIAASLGGNSPAGACHITHLDLCCNNIGDDGAKALGAALRSNTSLKILKLALNNIGNAGGIEIFKSLYSETGEPRNNTLEILDISANVMKEEKDDAEVLAAAATREGANAAEIAAIDKRQAELQDKAELNDDEEAEQQELQRKRGELMGVTDGVELGHTRPLFDAISKVFQRAHNLEEFDFTGIEFDTRGWETLANEFLKTTNIIGRDKDPLTIKFSIVDLMSEENLKIMNERIWDEDKKNQFKHIDWRRRDDAN